MGRFLLLLVVTFTSVGFAAAEQKSPVDGAVSKLTGSATMIVPGNPEPIVLREGDKVPSGAVITTGDESRLLLRTFNGTVATASANTTIEVEEISVTTEQGVVKKENTMIALKSGNLVSTLDPSKRSVNNYGVRTPKGVAAARGTVFSTEVALVSQITSISTSDGALTIEFGGQTYSIVAGTISINGAAPVSLASAASDPATAGTVDALLNAAVEAVSEVVEMGGTDLSAEAATSVLANVTQAAVTAAVAQQEARVNNPAIPAPTKSAEQITERVVAAVTSPNSATGGSGAGVTAALAAVTQAASNGVITGISQSASIRATAQALAQNLSPAEAAAAGAAAAVAAATGGAATAAVNAVATRVNATVATAQANNPALAAAVASGAVGAAVTGGATAATNNAAATGAQAAAAVTNPATAAATPAAPANPNANAPTIPIIDTSLIIVSPSS